MARVPLEAIALLPPEADTRRKVFEYLGFEALQAAHPALDLFVVAWKTDPTNPFAVVFGLPKDVVHIQGKGLPLIVDPRTRWAVVRSPDSDFDA